MQVGHKQHGLSWLATYPVSNILSSIAAAKSSADSYLYDLVSTDYYKSWSLSTKEQDHQFTENVKQIFW